MIPITPTVAKRRTGKVIKVGASGVKISYDDGGEEWIKPTRQILRPLPPSPSVAPVVELKKPLRAPLLADSIRNVMNAPPPAPKPAPTTLPAPPEPEECETGEREVAPVAAVSEAPKPSSLLADDPAADELLAEAEALLDMRRPVITKLEERIAMIKEQRRALFEKQQQLETMLVSLKLEPSPPGTAELVLVKKPAPPAAVEPPTSKYADLHKLIVEALTTNGSMTFRDIFEFVQDREPNVSRLRLQNVLQTGRRLKRKPRYVFNDALGIGLWSLP